MIFKLEKEALNKKRWKKGYLLFLENNETQVKVILLEKQDSSSHNCQIYFFLIKNKWNYLCVCNTGTVHMFLSFKEITLCSTVRTAK